VKLVTSSVNGHILEFLENISAAETRNIYITDINYYDYDDYYYWIQLIYWIAWQQ
jgi:hypothetical protein